jgi:hypothetical protein
MIGEQIVEWRGKTMGTRVLDAVGPTLETNISAKGNAGGTQVDLSITFVAKPVSEGVLHGKGQGVIMAGNSEMATTEAEGIGRITADGVKWRGAIFFRTASTGKLSPLNNVVGVFETVGDYEGNVTETVWEWK